MTATSQKSPAVNPESNRFSRWLIALAVIGVVGLLSAFYAINEYASGTAALIKSAQNNSNRFQAIYKDSAETKLATLRFGVAMALENAEITQAFIKNDRDALQAKVVPFFKDTLKPKFGIDQFRFWTPPATLYFRSNDPKSFGMDASAVRQTVVAAHERRSEIAAMETGLGGVIGLRAMAPVMDGNRLVGVIEMGSELTDLLNRASTTSGLDYAVGLNQERAKLVQRPADPTVDSLQGEDIFYIYSTDMAKKAIRGSSFNPRSTESRLLEIGPRTVFIRTFPLNNFSGVPTVVIATLLDLTDGFDNVRQAVAFKTAILFLLVTVTALVGIFQFRKIQAGLKKAISGQRAELEERAAFCEAAVIKLRDVDLIKRGFFSNLVTALNEPLQAVAGTLQHLADETEPANEKLSFALAETQRLARLIGDYEQIELFRQKLVKGDSPLVSVSDALNKTLEQDLAMFRRLPQLQIGIEAAANLPKVRADSDLLQRAFTGLALYAARGGGQGKLSIKAEVDAFGWVKISLSGSAFAAAGAPNEALLDESRQFLSRLSVEHNPSEISKTLVAVVLSRIIVEFYGGSLETAPVDKAQPGFVVRLPAAV